MTKTDSAPLDAAEAAALEQMLRAQRPSDDTIAGSVRERLRPVYAVVHILPRFEPGDRVDGKLELGALAALVASGEASHDKPKTDEEP